MEIRENNTLVEFLVEFFSEEEDTSFQETFREIFEKIQSYKTEINKLIEEKVLPIILNDELFEFKEQKEKITKLEEAKKEFFFHLEKFWLYEKHIVAFGGRFSSGKSSVINTILGVDKLLPVDVTPTTAIPTYLTAVKGLDEERIKNKFLIIGSGGEENETKLQTKLMNLNYLLNLRHNDIKEFPIPLSLFVKYFVIFPESIEHLTRIPIDLKTSLEKIVLVDTPGFDSASNIKDLEFSKETLKNAHVVFWVVDVNDGEMAEESINFLKKLKIKNGDNEGLPFELYIILNKAETKSPKGIKEVKRKIEETLENAKIPFKEVIPFSAKEPQEFTEELNYLRNLIFNESFNKIKSGEQAYLFFNILEDLINDAEERL